MDTATATPPAAQVDDIFAKETWTQQDCNNLCALLFQMPTGTDKFLTLAGKMIYEHPEPTGAAAVKVGMALYLRGQFEQAAKTLAAGTDNRDRRWYQGLCYRRLAR